MWSAAILTGGRARRLDGLDKGALIVDGVALLDRQLATLRTLTDSIVLIGGRGATAGPWPVVEDLRPGAGALGALHTALATAPAARVFVLAVDMPFVTSAFIRYLAELDEGAAAVVPVADGRWHPLCAMYRAGAADALGAAIDRGERTVRTAVAALEPRLVEPRDVAGFDTDGRLLVNLNTPDDLARWGVTAARPPVLHHSRGVNRTAAIESSQTTKR